MGRNTRSVTGFWYLLGSVGCQCPALTMAERKSKLKLWTGTEVYVTPSDNGAATATLAQAGRSRQQQTPSSWP